MAKALASMIAQVKREIAARYFDKAEHTLQDALSTDPGTAEVHEQRGLLAFGQGDMATALDALKTAVSLAPSNPDIRFTQLRIATSSDLRDLMGELAVEAVAAVPDDDRVLRLAAKALMKNRNYGLAATYWQRLAERTGESAAMAEAARALIAIRDFPKALACAEEALRREPGSGAAKIARMRALEGMAPDSAAFADAVLDVAASSPGDALEQLPYLLCYGLNETLVGVADECERQEIRIEPHLVPAIAKSMEAAAVDFEAQGRSDDGARARLAISRLEARA